jgi:3',5'-cyclic AMP phosphodiesterase CpdA
MIIAQITDLHVRPPGKRAYGSIDTNAMLGAAVRKIASLVPAPDCVICTGDLTDCGLPDEYAEMAHALGELPMPVFVIPGNHDRRDVLRRALGGSHRYLAQSDDFLNYVIDDFPVRLVALDTVVPGSDAGEICAQREAWLARALDRGSGKPTLVFMHHPPFRTGVAGMDAMMCRTSSSFTPLIERHSNIERVAAGHYHRPIVRRWAGTIGFVAPSTAHQVALDLRDGEPTRLVMEPPGLALHVHRDGIGMTSHVVPIGDFGPIRDFHSDPDYPGQKQ